MGKVNHHHAAHEHHHEAQEHHPEPPKPSRFSLFKHKVAGLFKDIVEVPPEELKPKEEVVEEVSPFQEIKEEEIEKEEEQVDEDVSVEDERERTRQQIHAHIVQNLNQAVSKWKETGEIGMHLEPPVPLSDRMKAVWDKIRPASAAVSAKLKCYADEVMEKVSSRLQKAEVEGHHVEPEAVIEEEWGTVLKKIEEVSSSSERDEIEKIYKQLIEE
ncbi:Uncharacterised protein [uncultured archaeon]|nr:Uncharacterised protein [uncultured archaeon]